MNTWTENPMIFDDERVNREWNKPGKHRIIARVVLNTLGSMGDGSLLGSNPVIVDPTDVVNMRRHRLALVYAVMRAVNMPSEPAQGIEGLKRSAAAPSAIPETRMLWQRGGVDGDGEGGNEDGGENEVQPLKTPSVVDGPPIVRPPADDSLALNPERDGCVGPDCDEAKSEVPDALRK